MGEEEAEGDDLGHPDADVEAHEGPEEGGGGVDDAAGWDVGYIEVAEAVVDVAVDPCGVLICMHESGRSCILS